MFFFITKNKNNFDYNLHADTENERKLFIYK